MRLYKKIYNNLSKPLYKSLYALESETTLLMEYFGGEQKKYSFNTDIIDEWGVIDTTDAIKMWIDGCVELNATMQNWPITEVHFNNPIKTIGDGVIDSLPNLEIVTFGSSLQNIPEIKDCPSLSSITFADDCSLNEVRTLTTSGCSVVGDISCGSFSVWENTDMSNNLAWNKVLNEDDLILYDGGSCRSISDIPEGVKSIVFGKSYSDIEYNNNPNLEKVEFLAPKISGTNILSQCNSLTSVSFPELGNTDALCFDCPNLSSVTFSDQKDFQIYDNSFSWCPNLKEIHLGYSPNFSYGYNIFNNVSTSGVLYLDDRYEGSEEVILPILRILGNDWDYEFEYTYLTFIGIENGSTLNLNKVGTPYENIIQYSFDKKYWFVYEWDENGTGNTITLNNGDKVYFRNAKHSSEVEGFSKDGSNYYKFVFLTGKFLCKGQLQSLVGIDYNNTKATGQQFRYLFQDADIIYSLPKIDNPNVASNMYYGTFYDCDNVRELYIKNTNTTSYAYYRLGRYSDNLLYVEYASSTFSYNTNWLQNVAAVGIFACPTALGTHDTITRGQNACPDNWYVVNTDKAIQLSGNTVTLFEGTPLDGNLQIYYSLDRSTPNQDFGIHYSQPFTISEPTWVTVSCCLNNNYYTRIFKKYLIPS